MGDPCVTVIIPTKNSSKNLDRCLQSIVRQEYKNFEIIVVDGYSTDNTVEIAEKYTDKIFFEKGRTRASGCNVGIQHANGDIIAFTDDDCEVPTNWLKEIVSTFEDKNLSILGGSTKTPDDSSKIEKAFGALVNHVLTFTYSWDACEKVMGCNSAYRKDALVEAGGFNESLPASEETELNFRLKRDGKGIRYSDNLFVLHNRRGTIRQFWKQHFNYGVGKGKWLRSNPAAVKVSNILVQLLVFGSFVFLPILSVFNLGVSFSLLLISALLVLVFSFYASVKEKQLSLFPFIILASILWVYSQGLGQLKGIILGGL